MKLKIISLSLTASLFVSAARAQDYALDWSSIGNGGGTSTGGVYAVSALIGEPVAGTMSGGEYTMDGGVFGDLDEAGELIVNGSFENVSNTFAGDSSGLMSLPIASTSIPGWTTTTAELAWVDNTNSFGAGTPFGRFSLELTGYHDGQPYGGVSQTISTTPGQKYQLALSVGSNADYPGAGGPKAVAVCAGAAGVVFTMTPTNTTGNRWSTFSFNFTANSTSTVVAIMGLIASGVYLGLDNVSVTPDSSPPGDTGELVVNGSFDDTDCLFAPDGSGVQSLPKLSTTIPGWTITGAELLWGVNGNVFGAHSPFGALFLDLTGYHDSPPYAGVTQTLATLAGQHYRLSFSLGAYEDAAAYRGPVSVGVTLGSVSNLFTFTPPAGATGNVWMTFTHDFTADSETTPLTIEGVGAFGGAYLGLDDISVVPQGPVFLITGFEKLENDLRLSFNSENGKDYAIQGRADLATGDWETLPGTTNSGTGGTVQTTVTNAFLTPQQFYRIQQLP